MISCYVNMFLQISLSMLIWLSLFQFQIERRSSPHSQTQLLLIVVLTIDCFSMGKKLSTLSCGQRVKMMSYTRFCRLDQHMEVCPYSSKLKPHIKTHVTLVKCHIFQYWLNMPLLLSYWVEIVFQLETTMVWEHGLVVA